MAFNPNSLSETTIKRFVDKLVQQNKQKDTWPPKRAVVQEDVAVMLGYKNWHELSKSVKDSLPTLKKDQLSTWINTPPSHPTEHYSRIPQQCTFDAALEHFIIKGSDKKRREYFDELLKLNPQIPFLFIQGENALPFLSTDHRKFFDYNPYKHCSAETNTTLDRSVLTPTVCNAIAHLVACKVGQHQHFDGIHEYIAHILLNTNLGPNMNALDLLGQEGQSSVAKYFSADPQTFPHSQHRQAIETFRNNLDLVATTANVLWYVLKSLTTKSFVDALSSNSQALGVRLFENMDVPVDYLAVFCDVWMRMHSGIKIIVVDGLHHNSNFYPTLSQNLSLWGEANTAVFVGAASDADLPNDPKSYQRFVSRIGRVNTI